MIMFVLAWYVYPIMAATVVGSMMLAYWWVSRQEKREADAEGPRPCLEHMGVNRDGMDLWCWQKTGHDGVHRDWWDQPDVREWTPGDDSHPTAEEIAQALVDLQQEDAAAHGYPTE